MHSSLQHEALHGHPFRSPTLNAALVFPALCLVIPYLRFRDTHLVHHCDCELTDPYDDPESNYLHHEDWNRLPAWRKRLHTFNNALAGRMLLGPLIGTLHFLIAELRNWNEPQVARGWLWHIPAAIIVLVWIQISSMPLWAYVLAAYGGLALIRIRTFAEHRAHEKSRARSVIIEDRGPLSLLFLNNNLHVVHHSQPSVAWYRLPAVYRAQREGFLTQNEGYVFGSYGEVFRSYALKSKDPVVHPLIDRQ